MMEIHRAIGAVTPEQAAEESSTAVEVLHKSLVAIRKELVRKNEIIEQMKKERAENEQSNGDLGEGGGQLKFEDLFEPTVDEEEEDDIVVNGAKGNFRRASAGAVLSQDFDQILLFEDAERINEKEREEEEEQEEERRANGGVGADFDPNAPPTRDPIMEFVMSEEEEEEADQEVGGHNGQLQVTVEDVDEDGKTIELVPNEDIQLHPPPPPSEARGRDLPRPIIRPSSSLLSPRSSSGSQTDITALDAAAKINSGLQAAASDRPPNKWSSEPKLSSSGRQVTFRVPAVSQVIPTSNMIGGGRYSILNRCIF